MMKVVLDEIERLFKSFENVALILVAITLAFWIARCTTKREVITQEHVTTLTHEVKVLTPIYVTDTVTAYRTRMRYDSTQIHDTVMRHDSVFIYKPLADTAINACSRALHDCEAIRLKNDSLTTQLSQQKRSWKDRLGCNVGPSLLARRDGTVVAGVGATCGLKIWP